MVFKQMFLLFEREDAVSPSLASVVGGTSEETPVRGRRHG